VICVPGSVVFYQQNTSARKYIVEKWTSQCDVANMFKWAPSRKLKRSKLIQCFPLVILWVVLWVVISLFEYQTGGQNLLTWLRSTSEYTQMRRVTNRNYSHYLRDLVWRSILRDWPARPVRLEPWMINRESDFFSNSERSKIVKFELVPEPSPLFDWKRCLKTCGVSDHWPGSPTFSELNLFIF
jgi:hypothetical protein